MKALTAVAGLALSLVTFTAPMCAQSISFGLRGSGNVPSGTFSDQTSGSNVLQGAKSGFGYGADVGVSLAMIGLYAGFDHVSFDCQATTCGSNGEYTLQGVTAGVKLMMPLATRFRPFVRGGVTFHDLTGTYGTGSTSSSLTTDRTPGYEVGVGGDYSFYSLASFTPMIRYVGQNFDAKIPGVTSTATTKNQGANYFSFDLGFSLHSPFGM